MRFLQLFSLVSSILIISLAGCRPDTLLPGDALVYVPDDVASVTAISPDRLMDKADFDGLKEMAFYKDFLEKARHENAAIARILEEPETAGIDLGHRIYLNVELDKPGQSGLVTMVFSLQDKATFEKTLDKLELKYLPASQNPGLFQTRSTALLWNDEVGILGIGREESVQQRTEAYLRTPHDGSISQNDDLLDALSGDYDVMNWISSRAFVELFQVEDLGKVARYTAEDLKENYLHSFLNFEAGEVKAVTEFHLRGKLSTDLALILDNKVNTDFSDKFPQENLFFFSNFGVRPKGINQLLIEFHIKGLSDEPFQKFGFTADDLINAFSGDAALAIYQEKSDGKFNFPTFLGALAIDSREHLDRILMAAQDRDIIRRIDSDRYQLLSDVPADRIIDPSDRVEGEILIRENILYFSDQPAHIDQVATGNFKASGKLTPEMKALAVRNAMVALMDITWMSQVDDDWTDLPVKTMISRAGRKGAGISLKMENDEANSLQQLLEWMNEQYEESQSRSSERDDEKS